jgi:RimJ/RimL family protein N-acetyltransferase
MPTPRLDPAPLGGALVALEPLAVEHIDAIAAAASTDRSTYTYANVPNGREAARRYVSMLLERRSRLIAAPYVQRAVDSGAVVGCTSLLNPQWWLGRSDPDEIEIGGTWLTPAAQRSGINTEAKLLLLTHVFETLGVQRVAICTDARNGASRAAIERIGARFEGILYRHRPSYEADRDGLRDSAMYSVVAPEWPPTKSHIIGLLARRGTVVPAR